MGIRFRKSALHNSNTSAKHAETTLSSLRQDTDLWYRICVLLHDLCTYCDDPSALRRLDLTTDKLFICAPYFSESDAVKLLTTRIQNTVEVATTEEQWARGSQKSPLSSSEMTTVEEAIKKQWTGFFDNRRASGKSRSCPWYYMVPIYMSVLGITREELKDSRFLRRVWRHGPGDLKSQ